MGIRGGAQRKRGRGKEVLFKGRVTKPVGEAEEIRRGKSPAGKAVPRGG